MNSSTTRSITRGMTRAGRFLRLSKGSTTASGCIRAWDISVRCSSNDRSLSLNHVSTKPGPAQESFSHQNGVRNYFAARGGPDHPLLFFNRALGPSHLRCKSFSVEIKQLKE